LRCRNGTTPLFGALELAQGQVVGECYLRRRHQEFLKFLRCLDQEFPEPVALDLVMDNYWHSQQGRGAHLAQEACPFPVSFCAHQLQLAEFGGTLVRRVVPSMYSSGCVRQRGGSEGSHLGVSRHLE
jgi:hypothetical protein